MPNLPQKAHSSAWSGQYAKEKVLEMDISYRLKLWTCRCIAKGEPLHVANPTKRLYSVSKHQNNKTATFGERRTCFWLRVLDDIPNRLCAIVFLIAFCPDLSDKCASLAGESRRSDLKVYGPRFQKEISKDHILLAFSSEQYNTCISAFYFNKFRSIQTK